MSEMSKEDLNHDYMAELAKIANRRFLRKYRWLIKPSRKHHIHPLLLQEALDVAEKIPTLRKEGEPIAVGIITKNADVKLNEAIVKLGAFHISKSSNFLQLGDSVDGSSMCYIVDERGMVTIGQIPKELVKETPRLTLKNASHEFHTIAFYVGKSCSEVYDTGELIQISRKGIWMTPCYVPLENLEKEGFPRHLLEHVFQWCIEMSETNKGCLFVVIKGDSPKYSSPMIRNCQFRKCKIDETSKSQITNLASLDGALILNAGDELVAIGQKLDPPPSANCDTESGRGTRHNSAVMYSKAVDSVVFVVSEDGPISIYFKGSLYARCFGELFGI
jgi:hypothetical protein